jgi:hypothetical protein
MQVNPFTACWNELIDAGDEWNELKKWLADQSDRYDQTPKFTQHTNAARECIAIGGSSLPAKPRLRQQLLALIPHFNAAMSDCTV